jgi:hypothetical protein
MVTPAGREQEAITMSVTIKKIKNPLARPIMFASQARCQYWRGCEKRATFIVPMFMGVIHVCAGHADK